MADFLRGIGEAILSVIDFIISLFKDLVYMIQMLADVVVNIPTYFSWLPGEILAVLIALISVVVIYKILGREG